MTSVPAPAPGAAQVLVAQAGYSVFEGGDSMFDSPVLAFLGIERGGYSEYNVFDHLDRPLGYCRQLPGSFLRTESPCQIIDAYHAPLFRIVPVFGLVTASYEVHGVSAGEFRVSVMGGGEMTIGSQSEPLGYVTGFGLGGGPAKRQEVLDHNRRPVAEIRTSEERGWFRVKRRDVVMNIDPMLGGELRHLLVAIPAINGQLRRRKKSNGY